MLGPYAQCVHALGDRKIEAERCFCTCKRIKTFLQNAMGQEHRSALGMLSIEKQLIRNTADFNEKAIDHFA